MMHQTDFYKVDHRRQYPEGTTLVFSNWTPRKSRIADVNEVVFFGLQAYIKRALGPEGLWQRSFFDRPKDEVVGRYAARLKGSGFDLSVDHVAALHDLGYLPLHIRALPEGTAVPIGVPMFTMWNTDSDFFWLTNYIETSLSANVWGPCTAATIAREYRRVLLRGAKMTGGDPTFVDFQGHDFSYRGMYGDDAAALSGAGHLLSFNGTDTIPAIDLLEEVYHAEPGTVGGSVPATEHSVMCMGGEADELETFRRLITEVYPTGIVSIVSDTWDFWRVVTETLPALHDEILMRDGTVVVRPDSGDPVNILCGDPDAAFGSAAHKGLIECLWDEFGGTHTDKGFKQLNPRVGAIYGDSITLDRAKQIVGRLLLKGFVPTPVLGIGSYTYQHVTRDTFGFALKATYGEVDGQPREIHKDPKTGTSEKKSALGLLWVDHELKLHQQGDWFDVNSPSNAMQTVFYDGHVHDEWTLSEIRRRVRAL